MTSTGIEHPILGVAHALEQMLDKAFGCEPVFVSTTDKAEAMTVSHRQEQRLVGLRLRGRGIRRRGWHRRRGPSGDRTPLIWS